MKGMAQDIIELMDHEGVQKAHGVAHDWGVALLCWLSSCFPDRFIDLALLTVGYGGPQKFDVDAINDMTAKGLGYSICGYITWFGESPNAGHLINEHVSRGLILYYRMTV